MTTKRYIGLDNLNPTGIKVDVRFGNLILEDTLMARMTCEFFRCIDKTYNDDSYLT